MKYSIVYSSPYYWLYNEDDNELIIKNVDRKIVRDKKLELESKEITPKDIGDAINDIFDIFGKGATS